MSLRATGEAISFWIATLHFIPLAMTHTLTFRLFSIYTDYIILGIFFNVNRFPICWNYIFVPCKNKPPRTAIAVRGCCYMFRYLSTRYIFNARYSLPLVRYDINPQQPVRAISRVSHIALARAYRKSVYGFISLFVKQARLRDPLSPALPPCYQYPLRETLPSYID